MEGLTLSAIQNLNEIIEQTKKDITAPNRDRAVLALKDLAATDSDAKTIAEYLIKLSYTVSQFFFENVVDTIDNERLTQIVNALITNEHFQKGKVNNIRYPKGFISVLSLAKAGKYQFSFSILNYILSQAETNGVFSDGCKNSFVKLIINNGGLTFIESVVNSVQLGEIECKEYEKNRLNRFIDAIMDMISVNEAKDVKTETLQPQKNDEAVIAPESEQPITQDSIVLPVNAITKIESSQTEMLSLLRKLSSSQTAIDSLAAQLTSRENEISDIRAQRNDKEQQLKTALIEIDEIKGKLTNAESDISDLTGRLRSSLSMDEISKNQELTTFKNDISEALKLDYSDFNATRESEYSPDLFDVYRSTLTRIFKLLKRFGITCE
jgi:peptidoglycan hydrolase-like protein with peptidoglycan-binding domain